MKQKKKIVDIQEEMFQRAFEKWEESGYTDKRSWDEMWFRVRECCQAIAKKMCIGVNNPNLEFRADEATIYYMSRILRDKIHPRRLSSWCYLGVKGSMYKKAYQREDAEISYDQYERYEQIERPEVIRGIFRPEMVK